MMIELKRETITYFKINLEIYKRNVAKVLE